MSHDYKCWHKALSKELCEYMDCFEDEPKVETLCIVKELAKTIKTLYEIEAYEIMFDCLEDCFGYDRDEHEFEDKNGGTDYVLYAVMNRYDPTRMTSGTSRYPTTTRGGQSYGRDYGTGADRRYGERYNERSTDKSMYQPYGMDYGMGYGWMNAYDGDRNRMMDDRRNGERNGERNGDRNGSRERDMDSRSGERGTDRSRGRYMNAAERRDTKDKMRKLSESEKREWLENLENADGTSGPMWDKEQTTAVAKKIGIKFDEFSESDFNIAMNLMYSDFCDAIEKAGQGMNKPEVYARMAKAFLDDEDGPDGEEKLALYFKNIVEADED